MLSGPVLGWAVGWIGGREGRRASVTRGISSISDWGLEFNWVGEV